MESLEGAYDVIKKYYNNISFIFLPNICNASCYFCYIDPTLSYKGKLSESNISNFDDYCKIAKSVGINEFRLTGGEPLIFSNFYKLVEILASYSCNYTLLTNGILLKERIQSLLKYKPQKITISYHSKENYKDIFNADYSFEELKEDLSKLIDNEINTTITITLLPENLTEIELLVSKLINVGIKSFKINYPNISSINNSLIKHYLEIIASLRNSYPNILFRFTDVKHTSCMLQYRGTLSLDLASLRLFDCCATVPYGNNIKINTLNKTDYILSILELYNNNKRSNHAPFPCKTELTFCPINLNNE